MSYVFKNEENMFWLLNLSTKWWMCLPRSYETTIGSVLLYLSARQKRQHHNQCRLTWSKTEGEAETAGIPTTNDLTSNLKEHAIVKFYLLPSWGARDTTILVPLYNNRSAHTSLTKKCALKLDLLEILYGISHPFGLPTQTFPRVVRSSSTFTSVWAAGVIPPQEVKSDLTHNIIHMYLQPLAAQMVPHKVSRTCLPFLCKDRVKTEVILVATHIPETENAKHLVTTTLLALPQHYHITFWVPHNKEPSVFIKWTRKCKLKLRRGGQQWQSRKA